MPKAALLKPEDYLLRAVELAHRGEGHTRPNPPVGAVVVAPDGSVLGEGWHARCGGDHAEVAALKSCSVSPVGATVYVSLEPCSKPGRVGACTEALKAARVGRVVYGCPDPNPRNAGGAKAALAEAEIPCDFVKCPACLDLIRPFAKHVTTGLPFVTVKLAMSLDGRICDRFGEARWVSSEKARQTTGHLRARVDAILVGGETVRKDNPSLLSHGARNDDLIRAVVSKSGNLPKDAQIFTDGAPNKTLVFSSPEEAIRELGALGCLHVLCEGGLKLAVSLAEAGLVDRWWTVLASKVIGERHISEATSIPEVQCLLD